FTDLYNPFHTQLLQLIELLQLQTNDIIQSRAYTDLLNLLRVQPLAVKARSAINHLVLSNSPHINDYHTLISFMYEYERAVIHASNTSISDKKSLLQQLKQQDFSVQDLNAAVHIQTGDDQLSQVMVALLRAPHPIDGPKWWDLTTQRINQLHLLAQNITKNMAQQSEYQHKQALMLLGLYLCSALLIASITLWLGKKILGNFMDKVTHIANDMQQMAADPKLNINIQVSGTDELARMACAMNHMINERQKANHALNLAAAVFDYSVEGIVITDANNHIELVNPAFCQITGYSLEDMKGRSPSLLSSGRHPKHFYSAMWASLQKEGKWEGEIWNKRKDGQVYPEYLAITVVRNEQGQIIQHIGLFMDISKRKQYEQDLWYQANFDVLTGLPNRKLFSERLQHEIHMAQHDLRKLAILLIDLDQFKYINDVQGHAAGDLLLIDVAKRLESIAGK
ncbi:MAG: diguanylate cyclase domain-containing protein, partial [Shewanella sp.]